LSVRSRVLVSPSVNDHQASVPPVRGRGDEHVWSMIGTLVAGPLTWGVIGLGIDHLVGTTRVFVGVGVALGFITSLLFVYVRHGRNP
jgi:F0F1-type ATP synthase assembly protein I